MKKTDKKRFLFTAKMIKKYFSETNKVRVIDIGYADLINPFLSNVDEYEVTGLDIEPNKTDNHYDYEVVKDANSDLAHLGVFDVIISHALIEHLETPYHFLRNLKTISHKNTLFIVGTPNPIGIPKFLFEYTMSKKFFYTQEHTYYFLPRWFIRIIEKSGFKLLKTKGNGADFILFSLPAPKILNSYITYVFKRNDE